MYLKCVNNINMKLLKYVKLQRLIVLHRLNHLFLHAIKSLRHQRQIAGRFIRIRGWDVQ